jgi:hypothetical protein
MNGMLARDEFMRDLKRLRSDYPMVHIRAWTPDDFHNTENGPDELGRRGEADWREPIHCSTAAELSKVMDEGASGQWMAIRRAVAGARSAQGHANGRDAGR